MVTVRVQREGVGQPPQEAFIRHRTPLDSVGAQITLMSAVNYRRGWRFSPLLSQGESTKRPLWSRFEE